jgi:uncharacterized protein
MQLAKIALAALAGAVLVAFVAVGRPDAARSAPDGDRTISVSGTGAVTVVPDRAHFSFGVETRGRTAAEALATNGTAMRKVIATLKAAGIANKDLQTQQVSLTPNYSDDGETVIGYSASNSVSATVRKLAQAGALIDKAVAAGANQVSGPSLDRSDRDQLYRKALEAAIADARAKAETIAGAAGLTLGRATQVQETSAAPPVYMAEAKAVAADEPTPIEAGTQDVQANVTVTFAAS